MATSLITTTRNELLARKGEWPAICEALESISYWWLTKFAQGRIREPGVSKIETLQGYFASHPRPDLASDALAARDVA